MPRVFLLVVARYAGARYGDALSSHGTLVCGPWPAVAHVWPTDPLVPDVEVERDWRVDTGEQISKEILDYDVQPMPEV